MEALADLNYAMNRGILGRLPVSGVSEDCRYGWLLSGMEEDLKERRSRFRLIHSMGILHPKHQHSLTGADGAPIVSGFLNRP